MPSRRADYERVASSARMPRQPCVRRRPTAADQACRAVRGRQDDIGEALKAIGRIGKTPLFKHAAVRVGAEHERTVARAGRR